MNVATHCDRCGNKLQADSRYDVSPQGGRCVKRAWCPGCYEMLVMSATKDSVDRYAKPNNKRHSHEPEDEVAVDD